MGRKLSEETKLKISVKRKEWLAANPDKHPWKNPDKANSVPCEKVKEILKSKGILFAPEFPPDVEGRFFAVDIAFPDRKIIWEINGNQHYERDGSLKPYYQERHDLLVSDGWIVYEIPYACCFKPEKIEEFISLSLNSPVKIEFDYFNYIPRVNWSGKNKCPNCDNLKTKSSEMCMSCKKERDKEYGRKGGRKKIYEKDKKASENNPKRDTCSCGSSKLSISKLCNSCFKLPENSKQRDWPSIEEMTKLVFEKPASLLAADLGISDSMITRFCKKYNIPKPNRGYWAKKAAEEKKGR